MKDSAAAVFRRLIALLVSTVLLPPTVAAPAPTLESIRARAPEREVIYFMLPDRFENGDPSNDQGGIKGDRLRTGFDLTSKGFYNGGDLKGLISRLDYIQGLGATAIWLGPIYKNKPVQGAPGQESAGYHGYWITDFTTVDPHFGTDDELRQLVEALRARGMKIYLDIITNHTADVISYRECPVSDCAYRSRADYPYTRRGGVDGPPINEGFAGDGARHQTAENFAKLIRPDFAYTPFVPRGEERVKVPAWLNEPIWYHNRGNTTFSGESNDMGDFAGLDDLMTENPRVVAGFIDIFGSWIDRYGVDGFRIDTAKHVNDEFWRAFTPAMLDRAKNKGIPNFHIFGEVFTDSPSDVSLLARYTRSAGLPTVLDFSFAAAVRETVAGNLGTDLLARLFADDVLYEGGAATALRSPTFISNHDFGRFAHFIFKKHPGVGREEALARVKLAHAMLLTLRGVPTLYSGDEQGFVGLGGDQSARQPLFASRVPEYLDQPILGTASTHAQSHFNAAHPLYTLIARLSNLRTAHAALHSGRQETRRYTEGKPGIFAVSRFDPSTGREYVLSFNTSSAPIVTQVQVETTSMEFEALEGHCELRASAPGSLKVSLPAFGFSVCAARGH
ncbi:MAG: alpha-amylase family glycosyl hydrolase [Gammaproteobacteria bacterium]